MVDLYVFKNKFANTPKFHESPIDCTQIITICRVSVKVLGENNELCFDEISEYLFAFDFATSSGRAEPVYNHSSSVLTRPQLFKRFVDTAMHCLDKSLSTDHE